MPCRWTAPSRGFALAHRAETAAIRVIARDTQSTTGTASAPVRTIEIHDVRARNARTRLRVETVAYPLAVAVLFAGGKDAMQLSQDGAIGWGRGNFLIRARPLFSRNGILTYHPTGNRRSPVEDDYYEVPTCT